MSPLTVILLFKTPAGGGHGEEGFWELDQWGGRYIGAMLGAVHRHLASGTPVVLMSNAIEVLHYDAPGWHSDPLWRTVDLAKSGPGWWAKPQMFSPEVSSGRCLYLDLDNVIGGDLSELVNLPLTPEAPLWMLDDKHIPGLPNGSTFLFDADHPAVRALWTEFSTSPSAVMKEFSTYPWKWSDQAFVADRLKKAGCTVPFMQDHLPKGYILNARGELDSEDWSDTRLVYGQANCKPHTSQHPFYLKNWV